MDLKPSIQKIYPENYKGGQCISFLHRITDIHTTGNYLSQKIATVNQFGIPVSKLNGDFRVGDTVITRESPVYGHGFLINNIIANDLRASESNFHNDQRVHHTRLISKNSSYIVGVLRGRFLLPIINANGMQLVKDKGTVYIITGNKDRRKIGLADLNSLGLFGDEPQNEMDTSGIPEYNDIVDGQIITHRQALGKLKKKGEKQNGKSKAVR